MEDTQDYQQLHRLILLQAKEDYVKLMHPQRRRKRHLAYAWESAVSCLFDTQWLATVLVNEFEEPMNLEDLAKAAMDRENVDIPKFREAIRNEAKEYWETRNLRTIDIPQSVVICDHVYSIGCLSAEEADAVSTYTVDYEAEMITLYESENTNLELVFCEAITEIIAYHTEARMAKKMRNQLAKEWYETLRINNCFIGD